MLFRSKIIRQQAERTKIDVHPFTIRHGGRRGRTAKLVRGFELFRRRGLPPKNLPVAAIQGEGLDSALVVCGEKKVVAPDARRGVAGRQGDFPNDVAPRSEMNGRLALQRNGQSVWTPELRPLRRRPCRKRNRGEQQRDEQGTDEDVV